jgi:hypothetical protein
LNECADFPVATAGATLGELEVADAEGLGAGAAADDDAASEHASALTVSIAAAIAERTAWLKG